MQFKYMSHRFMTYTFRALEHFEEQALPKLPCSIARLKDGHSPHPPDRRRLGTAMLSGLTSHPSISTSSITVLLRPSSSPAKEETIASLRSSGAEIIRGDVVLDPEDTLVNLFVNFDTIIGLGHRLLVGQGSAQDSLDEQLEVRRLLRAQQEVDWVVVSTGLFISFLFVPEVGPVDLKARRLRGLGSWETRVSLTSPKDIGRVTAEIVFEPQGTSRQVVYVAGDTVSYGEVANLVEDKFNGEWERKSWDLNALSRKLKDGPDDGMVKYKNVFGFGKGVAWNMKCTVNEERGLSMQSVKEYLGEMEIGSTCLG
ncbi:NAD(P)-binding protein [Xylariaceae sp. FL1019]|nr:NAD(P)-binding protein [Xylariaceae sp. FL1019]